MKNKMSKIAFIILSVVFVFSACMTVFAVTTKSVTANQNGLEATLNFNKQEYKADEKIEATLNVKNNNSYAVKNIQTELIVPSTMKLSKGSLKQEAFSLNAGESKVQEVALEKVVETNNNVPTTNEENKTNSPQTGDNVVVYIAMMVISAVALVVIAVKKKWVHKKKVMSLVLCFTLVGAMTLTSVVNAEPTTKEFTVEGTIKVDGEDVVIKGKVTYTHEIYSKLQIDGADKGMYVEGDTVTITAEDAPEGKHFAGWTVVKGNVTLADKNSKTTTFVMGTEEVEIKANYEVNKYTIEVTSGENGKVSPAGSVSVNYGENQEFTITANTGYHIENVEVDGENKGKIDTYTFTDVKENHKIKATFAINTYTITSTAGANGTITETATVNYGDSKTFTITPNAHYHIEKVVVDGEDKGTINTYTFTDVKESHTIDVTFAIDTFTITTKTNDGGSITGSTTVNYGENTTLNIVANAGYHIESVEVDGVNKGKIDIYTFDNVKENHTIKATFVIDTFTITTKTNDGGSITGNTTVNYNNNTTFTITPNTGYGIVEVKVDGTSVGAVTSYEFKNVMKNHTIEVIFGVTTEESFKTAVNKGGNVYLADNINLGSVFYEDSNVKIYGGDYKVSGSELIFQSGDASIESGYFEIIGIYISNFYSHNGYLAINGGYIDQLMVEYLFYNDFTLDINGGTVKSIDGYDIEQYVHIKGGTFYFDPTLYVNTSTHKISKTTDSDGVDIWIVTEK